LQTYDIGADTSNNIVVAGSFTGKIAINGSVHSESASATDIFIAKLSHSNGSVLWVNKYGGPSNDYARDLAIGPNNDILLTGLLTYPTGGESVDFGTGVLEGTGDDHEGFVARLSTIGDTVWVRRFGGPNNQVGNSVGVVGSKVLVAGYFEDSLTIDGQTIEQFSPQNFDGYSISLRYDDATARTLERMGSASGNVAIAQSSVSASGNICFGGAYDGLAQFSNFDLTSRGSVDGFVLLMTGD
jgi:hypothetical protein